MNPEITDKYIGHTTDFVKRKYSHKQSCNNPNNNCKLYNIMRENGGWNNWKMEIIAFHDCENHYEARKREQQYFEEYNATLNSIEPLPKHKVITTKNRSKSNHDGQTYKKYKCTQCTPSAEDIKQFKEAMHKSRELCKMVKDLLHSKGRT
jgi:hypothetical protein